MRIPSAISAKTKNFRAHRGQAMLETALAAIFITFIFLGIFQLTQMVSARILLDHAAARAARARAVGFNDFMCLKSARVAIIPVAGKRVWPLNLDGVDEAARVPTYLATEDESQARGVLEYERWQTMDFSVDSSFGASPKVTSSVGLTIPRFYDRSFGEDEGDGGCRDGVRIEGRAEVESHFPLYMNDQGL